MFCDGIIITEHQGALYHTFRREGLLLILMIRDAPENTALRDTVATWRVDSIPYTYTHSSAQAAFQFVQLHYQ